MLFRSVPALAQAIERALALPRPFADAALSPFTWYQSARRMAALLAGDGT